MNKDYWRRIWSERWLPNLPPAILALGLSWFLAPVVHQYFVEKQNMNAARFAFYNRFIENFGELRMTIRSVKTSCLEPDIHDSSTRAIDILNDQIRIKFEELVNSSYEIENFFGTHSSEQMIEMGQWFQRHKFTCKSVETDMVELISLEQQLDSTMRSIIYGKN